MKKVHYLQSNFLYLIVKNHVFADGNKRIAATLFIYFLNFYGILYKENKIVHFLILALKIINFVQFKKYIRKNLKFIFNFKNIKYKILKLKK